MNLRRTLVVRRRERTQRGGRRLARYDSGDPAVRHGPGISIERRVHGLNIVSRWFTTLLWFSVVVGLPEMRGRSVSSQAWPKLVSI
jgi:hypothetical protein